MKVDAALQGVGSLFLDSAPVIYHVERHPSYLDRMDVVYGLISRGSLIAVTSSVTLAECLVSPIRQQDSQLIVDFTQRIVKGYGVRFETIDAAAARQAAEVRARYGISLPDAFQIGAALNAQCDALLTNDHRLKIVQEIPIIVLDDLEL